MDKQTNKPKGTLTSDLVWGLATLLSFLYALYLTHQFVIYAFSRALWPMLLFWVLTMLLATQAPRK